jgi:hypothetical protein
MKIKTLLVAPLAVAAFSAAFAGPVRYKAENVVVFTGDDNYATSINANGQMVGVATSDSGAPATAWFWNGTTFVAQTLTTLNGQSNPIPTKLNDFMQIVGYATTPQSGPAQPYGLYWSAPQAGPILMSPLDGYSNGTCQIFGINNSGTMAGTANGWKVNNVFTNTLQAITGTAGVNTISNMKNPVNAATGTASLFAVNDAGIAVGTGFDSAGKKRGVRLSGTVMTTPLDPAGATNGVEFTDINQSGIIVGNFWNSANVMQSFSRTTSGVYTAVAKLSGALTNDDTMLKAINNSGAAVGLGSVAGSDRGLLWFNGTSYNLNSVLSSSNGTGIITEATDINDKMQISTKTIYNGNVVRAQRLNPIQTISGTVAMNGFIGSYFERYMSYEVYNFRGDEIESNNVLLTTPGSFSVDQIGQGAVKVRLKPQGCLARVVNLDLSPFEGATVNFTYLGGDIDGDNEVSILDYLKLSENFGRDSNSPEWHSNGFDMAAKYSDLDGDNEISILDYLILSGNYGMVGQD